MINTRTAKITVNTVEEFDQDRAKPTAVTVTVW